MSRSAHFYHEQESIVSQYSAVSEQQHFDDDVTRIRDSSRSRISFGSTMSYDEDDSVGTYTRIAGRLSMSSAMTNDS